MPNYPKSKSRMNGIIMVAVGVSSPFLVATGVAADQERPVLEEVIVTATKRSENLQDVAMSIRALGAEEIDVRGIQAMGDYLTSVPSVSYNEKGGGRSQITIRGVSTGALAVDPGTVGYYFGEVPVSAMARGNPDLKLYDVERVEVLRGPQGTLYGSGSMGGTIKVIPTPANTESVSGTAEAVVSDTNGGGTNYSVAASLNIPVTDSFAARITAYSYENEGFVDNHVRGATAYGIEDQEIDNIATESTTGGRLAMTWLASDNLSLDGTVIIQNQSVDGLPEVTLDDGQWAQNRWIAEDLNDDFEVYNLVLNYAGNGFSVMASTAYMERDWNQLRDVHSLGVLSFQPDAPLSLFDGNKEDLWVNEVRVSSTNDSNFQWMLGAFYQQKDVDFSNSLEWYGSEESIEQSLLGVIYGATPFTPLHSRNNAYEQDQKAVFGEVYYQFADKWKATAGLRWFEYEDDRDQSVFGIFSNGEERLSTSDSEYNPKVALDYTPNDDSLYYFSAAKGFRPGSPNNPLPETCDSDLNDIGFSEAPDGTEADSLWSYEVGGKLTLAEGRVVLNGAAYYIDWEDIPASVILPCGFSFGFNADTATVTGMEIEMSAQLSDHVRLDLGAAYTDSQLDATYDKVTGELRNKGGTTPGVPEYTFTVAGEYDFTLADRWDSLVRLDAHYVGSYYNALPSDTRRSESGDYTIVNLRWSTSFAAWSGEIFATNLLDETVDIVVDTEMPDGRIYRGRPRTLGARVRYRF